MIVMKDLVDVKTWYMSVEHACAIMLPREDNDALARCLLCIEELESAVCCSGVSGYICVGGHACLR